MGMELDRADTSAAEVVEGAEALSSPEQNLPASLQVGTLPKTENTSTATVPAADLDASGITFGGPLPAAERDSSGAAATRKPNSATTPDQAEPRGSLPPAGVEGGIVVRRGAPAGFDEKHPESLNNAVPNGKDVRNGANSINRVDEGGVLKPGGGHHDSKGGNKSETAPDAPGGNKSSETVPEKARTLQGKDLGKKMHPQASPEQQQQFEDMMRKFRSSMRLL